MNWNVDDGRIPETVGSLFRFVVKMPKAGDARSDRTEEVYDEGIPDLQ